MHSTICSPSRCACERANMKCQSTSNYRECGHVDLRPRVPAFAVCMWPLSHRCVDISIRVSRSVTRCQPRTKTARHRQPCGTLSACSRDALPCARFRALRSALAWRGASCRIAFRRPSVLDVVEARAEPHDPRRVVRRAGAGLMRREPGVDAFQECFALLLQKALEVRQRARVDGVVPRGALALLADLAAREAGEVGRARDVRRAPWLAELVARDFHIAPARELCELLPGDPATDQDMHQGPQPLSGSCED